MVAYTQLPVSALPEVDYPTIQVVTFYPGADPDVMASSVTAPLERQFGQVPGLSQMTSTSSLGSSIITLQFNLNENIDVEEQQVQAAINAATTYLPRDLPNPPIYSKVNPADSPILTLALTSDTLPLSKVEDLADTALAQKISQLPGVGLVSISGGQKPAVRIQANPTALASYGLSLEDIRTALAAANVNQAKGVLDGPRQSFTIGANDQLSTSAQYNSIVVAYKNGAPVRLSDIATAVDSAENVKQAAWMNTTPAVIVNIQRQPGSNIISVADRVKLLLKQLQSSLPAAVKVQVLTDRTETIRASVKDVQFELMLTVGLVVMVIFLFLRNLSATVIPSVAVPLSLVGTFGVMYLLGYSLNNLTLMALTISTGFVVDDAIVMIENIERYLEEGETPLEAALKGAGQIGFTIVSLTVSLIAVLIPLLFMGDIVGRLFREFAVTLAVTILVSAVVSLTLTPMMCAKLLKRHDPQHQSRFYKSTENFYNRVIEFYGRTLKFVLKHQTTTLLVTVGTLVLTLFLYVVVPKGFFPVQDTGVILGISEGPQNVSFPALAKSQQALAQVILKDPDVESLSSFIGIDGTNATPNSGRIQINLKSRDQRKTTATEIIRRLQPELAKVNDITLYMQPVQDLTVEDRVSRTQYQYSMEDADAQELSLWAPKLVDELRKLPSMRDVATDQQNGGLQSRTGDRSRHRVASGHSAAGHRRHAVRRLWTAPGLDHVYSVESVSRGAGSRSAVLAESGFAQEYLRALEQREPGSARVFQPFPDFEHCAGGEPPGTVSGGHAFVQPGAGSFAGRGDAGDPEGGAGHSPSTQHSHQLPGNGRGLSEFTFLRALADSGRDCDGVHRAGRALRELHSSHHDSLHAALGRRGRDPRSAFDPQRSGRRGADRNHSSDRHREEERHHDDRLRAGSRAGRAQTAGRGDFPGLPAALPSHHDDHHGGAAGRTAAGSWKRHRIGIAPSAGHHHRRRPAGKPVAHALHHAGRLSLVRPAGAAFLALEHWQSD